MSKKKVIISLAFLLIAALIAASAFIISQKMNSQHVNEENKENISSNIADNSTSNTPNRVTSSETTETINTNDGNKYEYDDDEWYTPKNRNKTAADVQSSERVPHQKFDIPEGELKETPNTMDREKMKDVARQFIEAYYMKGDDSLRRLSLAPVLDVEYITEHKDESLLYMDYVLNQLQPKEELDNISNITIDNAQAPNGTVRVELTQKVTRTMYDGEVLTESYSGQIILNLSDSYKVQNMRKQFR